MIKVAVAIEWPNTSVAGPTAWGKTMSSEQTDRTLVMIATYNEVENLEPLARAISAELPAADILVIDDASPDGTGQVADRLAQEGERVRVVHRVGKLGLGTATIAGMQYAIDHDYDLVISMDADFSHSPRYLPDLLAGMAEHDVMIGSRYVPGGGVRGWPWRRRWMSWAINVYSRLLLGLRARDCSGAFRCYRVAKLRQINFDRIYSRGYSFQEEFLCHCRRAGCRIGETPIIFEDRQQGSSKINWREALMALWALFYTAIRR